MSFLKKFSTPADTGNFISNLNAAPKIHFLSVAPRSRQAPFESSISARDRRDFWQAMRAQRPRRSSRHVVQSRDPAGVAPRTSGSVASDMGTEPLRRRIVQRGLLEPRYRASRTRLRRPASDGEQESPEVCPTSFVQTPNRHFPIRPHFIRLAVQSLNKTAKSLGRSTTRSGLVQEIPFDQDQKLATAKWKASRSHQETDPPPLPALIKEKFLEI